MRRKEAIGSSGLRSERLLLGGSGLAFSVDILIPFNSPIFVHTAFSFASMCWVGYPGDILDTI